MKKLTYLRLVLLLLPLLSQAQAPGELPGTSNTLGCASTEMMLSKQGLWLKQQQLEDLLLANRTPIAAGKPQPLPLVLPLVVHIIHQNGAENISDAQVFAAVEHLNQAFAHEGYYAQQGDGANTQIQFCLARRTPDGQLSNGITRTASALTNMIMETEDQALKDLSRWNPKDYVNIWVVKAISSQSSGPGVAGYAYLASAHGEPYDGLVCEAQFFGSSPAEDAVFIHEIGHYLNLYHTFEGGCSNSDCTSKGDRVCDTPPDQATHTNCLYNSCLTDANDTSPNNPFTADVDDMTENFMDYSPFECYRAFTVGQGERMRFAIENIRASLLESLGCIDPCSIPITAAFSVSSADILAGETIIFTNQSNGATHYSWSVNGSPEAITDQFSFQFTSPGKYAIQLKAFNSDPNCIVVAVDTVSVRCSVKAEFTLNATELTEGESITCINTSTGATDYSWIINGVEVSTTADLNYTFDKTGYYSITLRASNVFCSTDFLNSVIVYTDSPCRDSVTATHLYYSGVPSAGFYRTARFSPDGGLYAWSTNFVARFDAQRNTLWQVKATAPVNGLEDICVLDDGSTLYSVDIHKVLKINPDGTLGWSKSVSLPAGSVEFFSINLHDGAVFYSSGGSNLYMIKFLSNGTVAWSRRFHFNDETYFSGDFAHDYFIADENGFWLAGIVEENIPPFLPGGGLILRFDLAGNLLFSKRYRLDNNNNVAFYTLSVNKDKEFVASGVAGHNFEDEYFNYLTIKGDANGNVVWAKKFTQANTYQYYNLHKMRTKPGGGYLQMLRPAVSAGQWASWSEDGQLEFVGEMTSPGFLEDIIEKNDQMTGVVQSSWGDKDFYLFNLTAEGKPVDCTNFSTQTLPISDVNLIIADFPFTVKDTNFTITPYAVTIAPPPSLFKQTPFCIQPSPCIEFCDNGQDDDEDGLVDCLDPDCPCFDRDTTCTLTNTQQKIPDANITVDSSHCQTDRFELSLNICNLGSAVLPGDTPIAFYNGDPTSSAAALLFAPVIIQDSIAKGTCKTIKLEIPATYNTSIFMVINDNGNLPRPFNLASNFPSTEQPECQYENNMTSFSIQNQTPTLDLGPDISLCNNSVIQLSASPNFHKYRWQDGSTLPNFTAFAPGKYWVDAYDACGFKQTDTVQILLNTQKTLNLPDTLSYCKGDQLPLTVSGFASYTWAPADSLDCPDCASVQLLAAQSFTLYLTASDGNCFAADSVRVEVLPKPGLQLLVQNGDCDTPASITVTIEPGDFEIQWSNGLSGNVIFPSISGNYAVSVTNDAGCTVVDSAEILVADPNFGVVLQSSAIPCSGGSGTVTANGFGGTGQYNFAWSTGDSTQSISVLLPGWYSLTLTDSNGAGCMAIDSVEVEASGTLALEASSVQISCFGAKDGAAQAFSLEGTAPYTWLWSTGQTSASISGLAAGIYSVTVSDALACTGIVSLEIIEPGWILVAAQALDFKLCPNETTTINTMVTGGTPPYTFLWSNGLTDSILTGVSAGNYMLTVTDQNHCIGISVVEIEAVPMMVLLLDSVDHASGPMQADGSIFVQTTGGVSPVGFLWSNGATTKNLLGVLPGTYSLTVTDAAGCTQALSAIVDYVLSSGEQWAVAKGWNAQIRPNPSQAADAAQLVIESEHVQVFEIQVIDAIGRALWEGKMESIAGVIQVQIPTPAAAGVCWVRVSNGQELKSLKWMITD